MSGSFLGGMATGVLVAGISAGALSIMLPLPARLQAPVQTAQLAPVEAPVPPVAVAPAPAEPVPGVDPEPRDIAAVDPETVDPAPVAPTPPPVEAAPADADDTATEPEPVTPPIIGATVPQVPDQPQIAETAPAGQGASDSTPRPAAVAPSPVAEAADIAPQIEAVLPPSPSITETVPKVPEAPEQDIAALTPRPAPQPAPAPKAAPTPSVVPAPDALLPQPKAPEPPQEEQPAAEAPAPEAPKGAGAPGALRVPVPGGQISLPKVRTGRLPSIGGETQVPDEEEVAASDDADTGALTRNATRFEPEAGKPLFSVILVDTGADSVDRDALTSFAFPVTFAVPASRPDATQAAQAYRDAGFEVVVLVDGLPSGAKPQDMEVTLNTYLDAMPETVAIMDVERGGFQTNRALLRQMASILQESGHGLITYDRGLNAAEQIARTANIPNTAIFRTLDSKNETASTIGRYLDRAAFKAAQDGQVVMLGHTSAETVAALFTWALEGRGADMNLAPISAILTGQ